VCLHAVVFPRRLLLLGIALLSHVPLFVHLFQFDVHERIFPFTLSSPIPTTCDLVELVEQTCHLLCPTSQVHGSLRLHSGVVSCLLFFSRASTPQPHRLLRAHNQKGFPPLSLSRQATRTSRPLASGVSGHSSTFWSPIPLCAHTGIVGHYLVKPPDTSPS